MPDVSWKQVLGFHMDSYVDLPDDHPASFIHFLRTHLTQHVAMKEFFGIDGNTADPQRACRDYAEKLKAAKPQLCLAGIGENGHLAFNDPPEADFNDPLDVKIVQLDGVTRGQQVAEGWFKSLDDVPTSAITLTVPALLRVQKIIASVPGSRKAEIIRRVVEEPISTDCPATILRTHPDATVFLDVDSAAQLDPRTLVSTAV
jgi:glucosamine-6-phosphate deaminase